MHPWVRWLLGSILILVAGLLSVGAQNLAPNPNFTTGEGPKPDGWSLVDGAGSWVAAAHGGNGVLRVEGRGADTASWRTGPLSLRPGSLYFLRFRGRREAGAGGGTAFAGAGAVHRDYGLSEESREHGFVLAVPEGDAGAAARLGQWHVKGWLAFDRIEVAPVRAVHGRFGGARETELGEAESVRDGVYRFEPDLGWGGANSSRVLVTNRAGFNSNRWLFDPGSALVFRHGVATFDWREARVRIGINHHVAGTLTVEASTDGARWQALGEFDGNRRGGDLAVPAAMFPARELFVRLAARGAGASFQVDTYAVEARLDAGGFEAEGTTQFVDGEGRPVPAGSAALKRSFLDGPSFGHPLSSAGDLDLWWCEGAWKVGRQTPAPAGPGAPRARVELALARGEYEPVQVVLRPGGDQTLQEARVVNLRAPDGTASTLRITVEEVAYVRVVRPTDGSCVPGWYPDPLPPLRTPLGLRAGENQPLWLTVHASRDTVAGEHRGELELRTDRGSVRVPLAVTVWDFELPRDTHLHSALGLGMGEIARYHRLTNRADRVAVFEKYLRNFAEHRISPYSFYDHAPIDVTFDGEGTNRQARVDFTAFDRAAATWLDGARFSTFQLRLQGMGGGTFHSRHLGRLAGFEEGTPEHARLFRDYLGQVERHLRERGWLGQAFTYWFDEPDPKDYEFVVAGMKRLKDAAPGLRRMLTEQPEPALFGHVDIWCGLTPEWSVERVRGRRDAGEEVWWYICTGPKEPYVTEFIDHPGTELRLWPWQSWQYGVRGILIWATIYWSSPLAYPEPALQDPWRDPMSWVSGYGLPVGHRAPWGNGDGRFLYPPRRDPNAAPEPNLDPPISSVRWENLRDGLEDYEYFWLLGQELERLLKSRPNSPALAAARTLLVVPPGVSQDLTHFTTDPRPMLEHREKIARAITALRLVP